MDTKRITDIIVCLFWWLTISLVFPFQARKRNLVKKRWLRILLTLASPAAIISFLLVWFIYHLGCYSEIDSEDLLFKTRNDLVLLTGIHSFPEYELRVCWRDPFEGTICAKYKFSEKPTLKFFEEVKERCADEKDLYWKDYLDSGSIFERGWYVGPMAKPADVFPDNVTVQVYVADNGFTIKYDYQSFCFKGLSSQEELTDITSVDFPAFEIVNYSWHPVGPDAVAFMTLLLNEMPNKSFIHQLETKWKLDSPGCFIWEKEYYRAINEEMIPCETVCILVEENSRIVTMCWGSY